MVDKIQVQKRIARHSYETIELIKYPEKLITSRLSNKKSFHRILEKKLGNALKRNYPR